MISAGYLASVGSSSGSEVFKISSLAPEPGFGASSRSHTYPALLTITTRIFRVKLKGYRKLNLVLSKIVSRKRYEICLSPNFISLHI